MIRCGCKYFLLALVVICWPHPASSQDRVPVPQRNPFKFPLPQRTSVSQSHADTLRQEPLILQLRATLVSKDAPLAIVGDRVLGIGDEIEGYRLLRVREGEAIFTGRGGRLRLRVGPGEAGDNAD